MCDNLDKEKRILKKKRIAIEKKPKRDNLDYSQIKQLREYEKKKKTVMCVNLDYEKRGQKKKKRKA